MELSLHIEGRGFDDNLNKTQDWTVHCLLFTMKKKRMLIDNRIFCAKNYSNLVTIQ